MTGIRIVNTYPQAVPTVWRALTDPVLIPQWTVTGRGGRPEGFEPTVGTKFRFVGKPVPGWDGVVECEVLAVHEPEMLSYSWVGGAGEEPTIVTYHVEPAAAGTKFIYEHTGFKGLGGFFMSKLLGRVRRKMLNVGLPAVLDHIDSGDVPPTSTRT